jgi:flagellar basal-body rod protein FlgC
MTSVFSIAVSGLNAASQRLAVSAQNIVNKDSTKTLKDGQVIDEPYHAQQAQSISNALGGVSVVVKDANPPTTVTFNPDDPSADANGAVRVPNVDLETELVNQSIAAYDFKANLKSIKTQDDMLSSLLDIKS